MTKRWSSTRSLDGHTKRSAAKESRRESHKTLVEQMFAELMPEVTFVDCTEDADSSNKSSQLEEK